MRHTHRQLAGGLLLLERGTSPNLGPAACCCVAVGCRYQKGFDPLTPGFVYVDYNDAEGLKRTVRRINRLGRLRSLIPGKGRKGRSVRQAGGQTGSEQVVGGWVGK